MSSFFGLRLRRTTSATRYETWTHPPSSSNLARVDQPKPGHALPCVTVAGGAGSERCAHSRTLPCGAIRGCAPFLAREGVRTGRGHRVRGIARVVREDEQLRSSPSSTRLEHPWSSMRAHGPWRDPPLRTDRGSASSALSAKSERFLVNRGAFHRQDRTQRRRSLFVSTIGQPPSHVMLPFGSPCGFASRGSAYAFVTFP